MEFEDRDEGEGEGELGSPVPLTYDAPMSNSGQGGGIKESRGGESAAATTGVEGGGTDHRNIYGGGGGGGRKYRECLKNQAVGIGAHAVDGCREFMAGGEEGTLDALRCAACGCHRNFHRKEQEEGGTGGGATPRGGAIAAMELAGYHPQFSPYYRTPAGYLHHNYAAAAAAAAALGQQPRPAPLALPSTSGGGGHNREEQEDASHPLVTVGGAAGSGSGLRKRFRTKFSQEQKDRMLAFAQQLGWRIQKHDEAAVQQFCQETCVKRHALKVWMHNNKQTLGKKP